jgi:hypothetical protein
LCRRPMGTCAARRMTHCVRTVFFLLALALLEGTATASSEERQVAQQSTVGLGFYEGLGFGVSTLNPIITL